jgi:TetR/AcrR family fatty acid metabolism transcriptional regulator
VTEPKAPRDPAAHEARRRQILAAAATVFARQGFDRTRVGDIATEAGIAYGLVYHYFDSKEAVLDALFADNWQVTVKVIDGIADEPSPLRGKLLGIVGFLLTAWRLHRDVVDVVMREVVRSPRSLDPSRLEAFRRLYATLTRMFDDHRARGDLRGGVDPKLAAILLIGQLEILLTSFVARELLADDEAATARLAEAVVDTVLGGIA